MDVRLAGTGGRGGWPQPGCRCASCAAAAAAGRSRAPALVLVDGRAAAGPGPAPGRLPGTRSSEMPGGWTVTGPGRRPAAGRRRIGRHAAAAGRHGRPYDLVLLDLLDDPAQLGALRHRGLVRAGTVAAVRHADHRVSSEEELARRCRFWGVDRARDGDVLAVTPGRDDGRSGDPGPAAPGPGAGRGAVGEVAARRAQAGRRAAGDLPGRGPVPGRRPARRRSRVGRAGGGAPVTTAPVVADRGERSTRPGRCGRSPGPLLFDGVGTWLAAVMHEAGTWAADGGQAAGRSPRRSMSWSRRGGRPGPRGRGQRRGGLRACTRRPGPGGCSVTSWGGSTSGSPPSPRRRCWWWPGRALTLPS